MADNIRATPRNPVLGLFSDITQGGLNYLRDPRFRQSMMQLPAPVRPFGMGAVALPGLFESTGFPKTLERAAYGEPLTNIGMANVPTLKPETADLLMNVAPFAPAALRGAAATGRFVAPKAGQLAEGYMQRMGMMPGIVPAEGGLLTSSVKPQAPVSDLGFYSAAEQAALNLQRNKGTGQSFINDLMKAPDVKKEELAWTGLDEFLANKPNVTKQEVQDFLAGNRVDLQEVRMGGVLSPEMQTTRDALNSKYKTLVDNIADAKSQFEEGKISYAQLRNTVSNNQIQIQAFDTQINEINKTIPPTKYERYQLPGGENYREILLKLPNKPMEASKAAENYYTQFVKRGGEPEWSQLNPARQQEITNSMPAQAKNASASPEYRSSHFDEPNVLAHMRVNDRIDADGKKMLLIEEVQSDWHQAGREKGYANPKLQAQTQEKINALKEEHKRLGQLKELATTEQEKNAISRQRFDLMNQAQELSKVGTSGVPDAPFKDTWHQLALKRALKYAADNGYERVGLTTGAQQAERYDLSKQISSVVWNKESSKLTAYDKTATERRPLGREVINESGVTESNLSDYIGKEAAQKLIEQLPDSQDYRRLSGLDLQVGGEGMKKYYDEIYPAFLAKQGKKFNAKTGETRIKTGQGIPGGAPVRYIDISPEMKSGVSKGQPMFAAAPIVGVGLGAGQQQQPANILTNELDYPSNPMYTDPLGYSIR